MKSFTAVSAFALILALGSTTTAHAQPRAYDQPQGQTPGGNFLPETDPAVQKIASALGIDPAHITVSPPTHGYAAKTYLVKTRRGESYSCTIAGWSVGPFSAHDPGKCNAAAND